VVSLSAGLSGARYITVDGQPGRQISLNLIKIPTTRLLVRTLNDMGLIEIGEADEVDVSTKLMDDDVFVDEDDAAETGYVSSDCSTTSTSSDDEPEMCSTSIRRDDGSELCRVRLCGLLGAGGFGRVYEGELEDTCCRRRRRRVAVKVPRSRVSSGGGGDNSTDSFLAESALVRLRHPNVLSVLAVGWACLQCDDCDGLTVDRTPAIVMELAGRRDLQSVIDDSAQPLGLRRRVK